MKKRLKLFFIIIAGFLTAVLVFTALFIYLLYYHPQFLNESASGISGGAPASSFTTTTIEIDQTPILIIMGMIAALFYIILKL